MKNIENCKVSWLFPSLEGASYWHPVLSEFTKLFNRSVVYTGIWPGFISGFENAFQVKTIGKAKFIEVAPSKKYVPNFTYVSPIIIVHLFQFSPNVIFSSSFSVWTLLALLLKSIGRWKVIITYDGCSTTYDYLNSPFRLFFRRCMTNFADAFITNSHAGKAYLIQALGAKDSKVFAHPYEVPDLHAMKTFNFYDQNIQKFQKPVFLFIGQLIYRKGLHQLLKACAILKAKGKTNYSLLVLGTGPQQQEFQNLSKSYELTEIVQWIGQVNYENLGNYFANSDVFIFPSLEDTWGMVVLEAMAFGKPVLCSKWAGSAEIVIDGENGYIFDVHEPEQMANLMLKFIEYPALISSMGDKSKQIMSAHNPQEVSQFLEKVVEYTFSDQESRRA